MIGFSSNKLGSDLLLSFILRLSSVCSNKELIRFVVFKEQQRAQTTRLWHGQINCIYGRMSQSTRNQVLFWTLYIIALYVAANNNLTRLLVKSIYNSSCKQKQAIN